VTRWNRKTKLGLPTRKSPAVETEMQESGWWQRALESAIHETNAVEDKIGLARLAILERLVSPAGANRKDEDALFAALEELRAVDWDRLTGVRELISL